jgi:hypothetical protein
MEWLQLGLAAFSGFVLGIMITRRLEVQQLEDDLIEYKDENMHLAGLLYSIQNDKGESILEIVRERDSLRQLFNNMGGYD